MSVHLRLERYSDIGRRIGVIVYVHDVEYMILHFCGLVS